MAEHFSTLSSRAKLDDNRSFPKKAHRFTHERRLSIRSPKACQNVGSRSRVQALIKTFDDDSG